MGSARGGSEMTVADPQARGSDLKLEAVVIPVVDVERAKAFYSKLGWRLDADFAFDNGFRVVQFTPPGSACSVQFGTKITLATPGSAQGLYLIVADVEAARAGLAAHGAEVSEVFHAGTPGAQFQPDGTTGRVSGPRARSRQLWLVRHLPRPGRQRLAAPGGDHALAGTRRRRPTPPSHRRAELAAALRRAAAAHGEHEKRTGQHDVGWPDWYADYIVREQAGEPPPA